MLPSLSLLALSAIASLAEAQSATSTYVETAVPTGTPIPGDYTGALRPQIHYSPPTNFMNDPNGMFVDSNGTYHLYYQYNPTDIVAGNQHWGHATSQDLYHWTNQPIAIYPGAEGEGIFSGSAVIDTNNTSGFFPNQTNGVVAIYTLNTAEEETQNLAYSFDDGYTFTKYSNNPVLSINSTQFRDPKVIWYPATERWVMVVAYAQEFVIGVFTSPDLKDWTHASNFSHHGLLGLQYECPNLVQLPMLTNASLSTPLTASNFESTPMWMLAISINPGAPLGGSITQYFPGTFNGTHFTPSDSAARIADFGKDNYAGQWFYGIPATEPQVSIAWASNWQYSQVVPTGPLEGFRSAMSLPRLNVLANTTRGPYTLVSIPYDLSGLYTTPYSLANTTTANSSPQHHQHPPANTTGTANFTFLSSVTGESVRGGLYLGGDTPFFLNRGYVRGFENPFFTDKFSVTNLVDTDTRSARVEVVIDRSVVEVFLDGGVRSATATFFPTGGLDTVIVATAGLNQGVGVQVGVWGLESAWAAEVEGGMGEMGNVTGNATMVAGQRVRRDHLGHLESR
ncbi:invertase 2 [Physcia stellaris]|nr:invertase 2 [Physcia stellaris]